MGINDDNFVPPRSHNFMELDLNMFSSKKHSTSRMITIKRTDENTREFCTLMHLQEQKKNLRKYSVMMIEHANAEDEVMQKLLKKQEKRLAFLNEEVAFYKQTYVETVDDLVYLKNVIENLKQRLISIGEESAIWEVMGDESGEERIPNEE